METENDNTIPFLDLLVIKDSEGRLTTSAYKSVLRLTPPSTSQTS